MEHLTASDLDKVFVDSWWCVQGGSAAVEKRVTLSVLAPHDGIPGFGLQSEGSALGRACVDVRLSMLLTPTHVQAMLSVPDDHVTLNRDFLEERLKDQVQDVVLTQRRRYYPRTANLDHFPRHMFQSSLVHPWSIPDRFYSSRSSKQSVGKYIVAIKGRREPVEEQRHRVWCKGSEMVGMESIRAACERQDEADEEDMLGFADGGCWCWC